MEEIHLEYILCASADAHMEATSSMSPKLKEKSAKGILSLYSPSLSHRLVTGTA
jgi:hypothetical protein